MVSTIKQDGMQAVIVQRFGGVIEVVDTTQQLPSFERNFADALKSNGRIVGFDMEWVPDRCAQHDHKVALVQLAVGDVVWLLRTCVLRWKLPPFVERALRDPSTIKLTIDFGSADQAKLLSSFGLQIDDPEEAGILDLSCIAKSCGITGYGLKKLAARYGFNIEKNRKESCSNWAAAQLSPAQVRYAAEDAYFPQLVASKLLVEDGVIDETSKLRAAALSGLAKSARRVEAALRTEDCSERISAVKELVEDVWALLDAAQNRGEPALTLSELQPRLPHNRARALGVSYGRNFFQENGEHFALIKVRGTQGVRARSAAERAPPNEQALSLEWAEAPQAALAAWAAAEQEELSAGQLTHRLLQVARALERSGEAAKAAAIRTMAAKDQHKLVSLMRREEPASLPAKAEVGAKARAGPKAAGSQLEAMAGPEAQVESKSSDVQESISSGPKAAGGPEAVHVQPDATAGPKAKAGPKVAHSDPSCTVFLGKLAPEWGGDKVRRLASAAAGPEFSDIVVPMRKQGGGNQRFAFLVLRDADAASDFLKKAGAGENSTGTLTLGDRACEVRPYKAR